MDDGGLASDPASRQQRAQLTLEGLSLGDAFGNQFFELGNWSTTAYGQLPPAPWNYTDDTEMALAIVEVLARSNHIDQDALADEFMRRFAADPDRGYGAGTHALLDSIRRGADWREETRAAFGGQGSLGNGGAMRVAPLGAYFADDLAAVVDQARASATVTHTHAEGVAGTIAVAVAAAVAVRSRDSETAADDLFAAVLDHTPDSLTRERIQSANQLSFATTEEEAAAELGNGSEITAPDTVPFCLWCAAWNLDDYCEALWKTLTVGGDVDTNCAIVGGIVASANREGGVPGEWLKRREPLS